MADEAPKIHVDSDWKAEAQKERERLAKQQEKAAADGAAGAVGREAGGAGAPRGMPKANVETLISTMATQALFAMGAIADPSTGQRMQHLPLARHHIDMLSVLEEKTKGNLAEEEANLLAGTLYELRQRYIELANAQRSMG